MFFQHYQQFNILQSRLEEEEKVLGRNKGSIDEAVRLADSHKRPREERKSSSESGASSSSLEEKIASLKRSNEMAS